MDKLLVSIIIPTYNRGNLISETLNSILSQTYQNWECLVIDDGSIDNTKLIVEGYVNDDNRFYYYQRPNKRNKGANACRNFGFELCTGDSIIWFDDDDLMHRDLLLKQTNSLKSINYNYSVCQTLVFKEKVENIIGLKSKVINSNNIFEDYLKQKVILLTPSAIWKKTFLNKFEYLFDEDLQAAQEWEFYCRVLSTCPDYAILTDELVYIREHEGNMSSKSNYRLKLWNYFLARYKVYSNKSIMLNESLIVFLEDFMLFYFKQMIRKGYLKEAFLAFKIFVIKTSRLSLKAKFSAFLSLVSFTIFNRGDFFLKRISF
jgi:glycosyltransferase involved in cell wall biosynthesis